MLGFLGDVFKGVTSLFGGGGGSSGLSNYLAGQLTAQRIPGQTRAGEYTPPEGGFGTYNYIPTGATQIDPQLISMILGQGAGNTSAINTATPHNNSLLQNQINNPYAAQMQSRMDLAGDRALHSAALGGTMSDALSGMGVPIWNARNTEMDQLGRILNFVTNDPYLQPYLSGASSIGSGMMGAGADIQNYGGDYLSQVSNQVQQLNTNPYIQQAQMGANTAGQMLQGAGSSAYGQGQMLGQAGMGALPASQAVLNTAFDPQNALYNRALQQTQDQLGVYLANSGLTNSGAGAGIVGDQLRNFNIDWQNNQLGRQTQGLQSYTQGVTGAGNNMSAGSNLQALGASNYAGGAALPAQTYQGLGQLQLGNLDALGRAIGTTGNIYTQGFGMQEAGNAMPYNAVQQSIGDQLRAVQAYAGGANNMGSSLGQIGQNAATAFNLGGSAAALGAQGGAYPYQAYQTNYGNQNAALGNYLNNQSSASNLSNQSIGQMLQYLGAVGTGAGNAANAASGAQTNTMNQNASAAAGLQPIIQGGLDWIGSLFNKGSTPGNPNVFNQVMQF